MLLVLIDSPQKERESLDCMHILVKNWIKSDFRENVQKKNERLPQTYLMFVNILFANVCTCFDFSISKKFAFSLQFLFILLPAHDRIQLASSINSILFHKIWICWFHMDFECMVCLVVLYVVCSVAAAKITSFSFLLSPSLSLPNRKF